MMVVRRVQPSILVAGILLVFGAAPATGQRPGEGGKEARKGDLAVQSLELVPLSSAVAVRVKVRNINYDDATWATKPPVIRVSCVSPDAETVTRVGRVRPMRPNGTEEFFFTRTMPSNPMDPIAIAASLEELFTGGGSPPEQTGILKPGVAWQCTAELVTPDDDSSNNRAKGGQAASYDLAITMLEFVNSGSSPPTAIAKASLEGTSVQRKVQLQCSKSGEPARMEEKEIAWTGTIFQGYKGTVTFGKPGAGFVPSAAGWQCTARITGGKGPDKNPANDVFTAPVP